MSLKSKLFSFLTMIFAVTAFSAAAIAQETPTTSKEGETKVEKTERKGFGKRGERGMHGGKFGKHGGMRGFHGIELTDAQKEQIRAIREAKRPDPALIDEIKTIMQAKRAGTITPEQQERARVLRAQAREKGELVRSQIEAVFTPEQRQQIEQKKQEMRQRWEERRQQRQLRETESSKPVEN